MLVIKKSYIGPECPTMSFGLNIDLKKAHKEQLIVEHRSEAMLGCCGPRGQIGPDCIAC
jgi:hypothetical protein